MINIKDCLSKYDIRTKKLTYLDNYVIINSDQSNYLLKMKDSDKEHLFNYLNQVRYDYFLPIENNYNDYYELYPYYKDNITDSELVVLVNQYSASASEILVGALRDNDRAKIVGTTTFGKGVIQNVFSLKDGSVLKLTVAEYYTPKGTKINKQGIKPDYEVKIEEVEKEEDFVDNQLEKAKEILK